MLFPEHSSVNIYNVNRAYINNVGKTFGKWIVISLFMKKGRSHYLCQCQCGRTSTPASYHVINGFTSACNSCAPKKHGLYNTPTNRAWNGVRNRCNNPNNKDYIHYGGRGIKICERWNKYENFLADMGEKPKGLTLDRIDNNGNYEPGNCRWATYSQQNSNQRKRFSQKIISR